MKKTNSQLSKKLTLWFSKVGRFFENDFSRGIVKNRLLIIIITSVLVILGGVGVFLGMEKINSDMLEYIPDNTQTAIGKDFLYENFGIKADGMVAVKGSSYDPESEYYDENDYQELCKIAEEFSQVEGVNQVLWIGTMLEGSEMVDNLDKSTSNPLVKAYMEREWGSSNFLNAVNNMLNERLNITDPAKKIDISTAIDWQQIFDYLVRDNGDNTYSYIMLALLDYGPSTDEAFGVLDQFREIVDKTGREYAINGMTANAQIIMDRTFSELPIYLAIGFTAVFILLFLGGKSYIEPFILMMTLGIAIIVNMGSNIIFPSISTVTFAVSAILQLGVSMDYAIFFMHAYSRERERTLDPVEAARKTIPKTFVSVAASTFTTVGGFAALFAMQLKFGPDLAKVLVKGVLLSFITVMLVQPCITIYLDKTIIKSKKKALGFNFEKVAAFSVNKRKIILTVMAILVIPCAVLANAFVKYNYLKFYEKEKVITSTEATAGDMANSVIIAAPLLFAEDAPENARPKDYIKEITDLKYSGDKGLSIFSAIDLSGEQLISLISLLEDFTYDPNADTSSMSEEELNEYIMKETISNVMKQENIDTSLLTENMGSLLVERDGKYYTLYIFTISNEIEDESQEAFDTVYRIRDISEKYFGSGNYYVLSVSQARVDMADITPTDFTWVTIISILSILLVMIVLLRDVGKSVVLVLLIQLGIWINLTINVLFDFLPEITVTTNFFGYLVIGALQLGITVDYAILMSNTFEDVKKRESDTLKAAKIAAVESLPSILMSAAIITIVTLSVYFVATNLIVKEIVMLVARGAVISFLLVMLVLPGLLASFKKVRLDNVTKMLEDIRAKLFSDKSPKFSKDKEPSDDKSSDNNAVAKDRK